MTKMSKIKIEARRRAQRANRKVQNTERKLSGARVEAQLAAIEAQIASLQAQSAVLKEGARGEGRGAREVASGELRGASGEKSCTSQCSPHATHHPQHTTESLAPSPSSLATTPPNSTATFLHTWLGELQIMFENFAELVPELENTELNTTDRRRLLGSGVRRYGFIEKVLEVGRDYPQFWPAFGGDEAELRERVDEIDALRNLLVWFRVATRTVGDLLLIAGDDAFRIAGSYYATSRDGARRKNPGAVQVFEMLRLFWRRRRMNGEPTEKELEHDFHALMRGTKDGKVAMENESDQVVRGERVLMDHTM